LTKVSIVVQNKSTRDIVVIAEEVIWIFTFNSRIRAEENVARVMMLANREP